MHLKSFTRVILLTMCTFMSACINGNCWPHSVRQNVITIICPENAPANIKLAASEARRYIYLRTGQLLPILEVASGNIVSFNIDKSLDKQEYKLKSDGKSLTISGGSDVAVLYGTYAFVEKLGVRFYLHGDVVPDGKIPLHIPVLDEIYKPLFETRGILPFHDFPEGPDWWTREDFLVYLAQLAKMKMNFIGMHNYSGELLLWHGLAQDVAKDGSVKSDYPSKWFANTYRNGWGYTPMPTGEYSGGASGLFPSDTVMSEIIGHDNRHFDRAGKLLGQITSNAHKLGIKVCVGSESPVWIPAQAQARLEAVKNSDQAKEIYQGIFTWLKKNASIDYFWLWTPENWIWNGNTEEQYKKVEKDISQAIQALDNTGNAFQLATCGWVIGPQQDRLAWDAILPLGAPIANISRFVGHAALDSGFSIIRNRPKWAIPWFENDPDLVAYQPWVKRMRFDAVEARQKGCSGLIGIHWRTKILSVNILALAQAGWDQSWNTMPALPSNFSSWNDEMNRQMPAMDFYLDFAKNQFGENMADRVAKILEKADGFTTMFNPEKPDFVSTTAWINGPGGLRTISKSWDSMEKKYSFVQEFNASRPYIKGKGNLERFDYWMNTLSATRQMAKLGCMKGEFESLVNNLKSLKDEQEKLRLTQSALDLRIRLTREWEKLIEFEIGTVSTPGELGTIANLEQHSRIGNKFLTSHDSILVTALGKELPASCFPSKSYSGKPKLCVQTVRSTISRGESLKIRILAIDKKPVKSISVFSRSLGTALWNRRLASHIARGIWEISFPSETEDFEYYVRAETYDSKKIVWPATAPSLNQSVVVW